MKAKKFRVVPCLLFTLAALLTVPSASIAQIQSTAATAGPTVTRFHFTDNGDDLAGRMTTMPRETSTFLLPSQPLTPFRMPLASPFSSTTSMGSCKERFATRTLPENFRASLKPLRLTSMATSTRLASPLSVDS